MKTNPGAKKRFSLTGTGIVSAVGYFNKKPLLNSALAACAATAVMLVDDAAAGRAGTSLALLPQPAPHIRARGVSRRDQVDTVVFLIPPA